MTKVINIMLGAVVASNAVKTIVQHNDTEAEISVVKVYDTDCQPSSPWLGAAASASVCASMCKNSEPEATRFVWVEHADKNCKCASGSCSSVTGAYNQNFMVTYEYLNALGDATGNGYCRVMTETGPEKHTDWTTYKKCIDLASCRGECHEGCAGIAWTATPVADFNFEECYEQGKPRCVVYMGMAPATTYKVDMAQGQDYTCYPGPGGAAIPTGTALGNGYCRVMTESGPEKHTDWTTYKECIDLASCRAECHEGCAGIAWTATPAADANFDECYQQSKPRCVVYMGMRPATTYATDMASTQDYTCYRGPGGAAIDTIG